MAGGAARGAGGRIVSLFRRSSPNTVELTPDEMIVVMAVIAGARPEDYADDDVKSVIFKVKAASKAKRNLYFRALTIVPKV